MKCYSSRGKDILSGRYQCIKSINVCYLIERPKCFQNFFVFSASLSILYPKKCPLLFCRFIPFLSLLQFAFGFSFVVLPSFCASQ